jgi:hypothetical protein
MSNCFFSRSTYLKEKAVHPNYKDQSLRQIKNVRTTAAAVQLGRSWESFREF